MALNLKTPPLTGGYAFPRAETAEGSGEHGMTLRDWFAGQALLGALAALMDPSNMTPEQFAEMSYQIADAMLAERNK
jgi:hypothetical protein